MLEDMSIEVGSEEDEVAVLDELVVELDEVGCVLVMGLVVVAGFDEDVVVGVTADELV